MNNRKLLSVSLTILLAVALLALVAPAVSAQDQGQGNVTVALEPADGEAQTGEVQTYDINVVDADNGIGAYEFNVTVGDTGVGVIDGYELTAQNVNDGPYDNSEIVGDDTLALEVALGNASHDAAATDGMAFTVATVDVNATGSFGDSTTVATATGPGAATVAEPTVGQNETANETYTVNSFGDASFSVVADPSETVDIGLEPASVTSGPGGVTTYEVVITGATEGISAYDNIRAEIQDPSVAQFTNFTENKDVGFGNTTILDGNGNSAAEGPAFLLQRVLGQDTIAGAEKITLATLETTATGSVGDTTTVEIAQTDREGDTPALSDSNNDPYPIGNLTSSSYEISFDMSLDFNAQEVAPDDTVTVENVESDGEPAAVVVTYPSESGLVIAGVSTGTYAGDDVAVEIADFGGFTGDPPSGQHTAHIIPVSGLSQAYEAGDIVSSETAGAIIDNEAATVVNPEILPIDTGDGFGINVGDDLSIADDYPRNQRGAFLSASSLYGPSIFDLPEDAAIPEDERFLPIATGSHVGPTGLPIQDEIYQWFDVDSDYVNDTGPVRDGTLLNFQNSSLYDPPTQLVSLGFYTEGDFAEVSNTVTLNYGEAASHGLEIDPSLTGPGLVDTTENFNINPANVTIDRISNEVRFTYGDGEILGDDPIVQFALTFVADDPVEGLDVPGTIDYETDHKIEQNVRQAGDDDFVTASFQENFVTFEAGATALSADAVTAGSFLNETVSGTDLLADIDSDAAVDGEANPGSFLVRQGQIVTLEADTPGDTINVFEVGTTTNAEGEEVYTLGENVVGFDDTAPGRVANLDTSTLDADTRYFVTFGDDTSNAAVLDVRPLNLDASPETDTIGFNNQDQQFEVSVTSDDSTDNAFIETWFHFNGTQIDDVVHVERETLTGTGDRDVEINPALDLVGPGDYTVTVLHSESGVTEQFEFEIADEPVPTLVEAEDVNIVSPDLESPDVPGQFDRGDVIPIELELEGGNVATITFGDRDEQNVEITATVFDPTYDTEDVANDADTTVDLFLSTYHIGHGYVANGSVDDLELNTPPDWDTSGVADNRNHGFIAAPGDPTSALLSASELDREHNVYAEGSIDIYGGSQGGAVLSPDPGYDLHATGGELPYTIIGDDERDDVNFLRISDRSTQDFRFWTAPGEGNAAINIGPDTTAEEIETLVDQELLSELETETVTETDAVGNEFERIRFNGQVAEGDFLVVQAEATGLEGPLLEAELRQNPSGTNIQDLIDTITGTADDGVITSAFLNATSEMVPDSEPGDEPNNRLLDYRFDLIENQTSYQQRIAEPEPNEELLVPDRIDPDLSVSSVVANLSADNTPSEFYVPYKVGVDLPVETGSNTDTETLTFDSNARLEPRGGTQPSVPTSVNPLLTVDSIGQQTVDELGYVPAQVSVDSQHTGQSGLEVPRVDNYTIDGTSTMASGTTVNIVLLSETDEATPFLKTREGVELTAQNDSPLSAWEATFDFSETRDNVEIEGGTVFEADITRAGAGAVAGGEDIPGLVLNDPAVGNFTFNNQRGDGGVVTVEAFEANRATRITVQGADGTELGTSDVLPRGQLQEQFNIELDQSISSNQQVTAVAEVVKPEVDLELASETAEILVEDQQEAFFDVSDLSPTNGQVEQGATVTAEATVENLGDLEGQQSVTFSVVGTDISVSETVTLAGGESTTVDFDLDTTDVPANSYTHQIASEDDSVTGGLTVQAPPAPAAFEIVSLVPADASVTQGDELVVDVSVQNTGEQEGTQDVVLSVSGLGDVGSQSLTLAGGAADSVSFTVDTTDVEAGDYTHSVSVGNASAEGSLTIMEPAPADDSADDSADNDTDNGTDNASSDDGSGPGFGIVVAALALLGAALLAMRRQVE